MGSSYSACYIRTDDAEAVKKRFPHAVVVEGSPWVASKQSDSPPADDVLWGRASLTEQLSAQLGEVVFLFADTSPDSFVYEHSRGGALLRKLVWFPLLDDDWTPGWLCAHGEPEEWEAPLFRPQQLSQALDEEEAIYAERGEEDRFAERAAEIRRVFEARTIAAGTTIPRADASVARLVERHFGLQRPAR